MYCEVYGGYWEGPIFPPGGGPDDPIDYPAPHCEIVGVSDENPDQPILSIQANDAVVSMALAYDGWTNQTVGPTDTIAMQPINYFAEGSTSVTVQCRNAVNVYSTPMMNVGRSAGWYNESAVVYGVWTELKIGDEPEQGHGEWHRSVTLDTMETWYSIATFGTRNGMYQHMKVEDQLYAVGDTPKPAWDNDYVINSWSGGQAHYWSWRCGDEYWQEGNCTDVNAFVTPYAPNGTAIINEINVPRQGSLFVSLLAGQEVSVGPN